MNKDLPKRRHPAHMPPVARHNQPIILFVTVSVQGRASLLANDRMHTALCHVWKSADHWRVGPYMIMPEHVHLFCVPGVIDTVNVKRWVKFWKGLLRKHLALDRSIWQRDCWDTQMRDAEHYHEKRAYVRENPVRKGLVEKTEDWKYQGELQKIGWR